MQDHSHKLAFLALTGMMCAICLYGSQAGPSLFMSHVQPEFTVPDAAIDGGRQHGLAQAVNFVAPDSDRTAAAEGATGEGPQPAGTASILPDKASCPAASALVSPPSVNGAIGSPSPVDRVAPPARVPSDAVLGTGSGCPRVHRGTGGSAKEPLDTPTFPNPQAANTLPQVPLHP